jgi:hypothetical protein
MWLLAAESITSLVWVLALIASLLVTLLSVAISGSDLLGLGLAWGIAIAVLATLQTAVALWIRTPYDPRGWLAYALAPVYPVAYWLIAGAAAARSETVGLVRGAKQDRVVWDIPREG